MQTLHSQIKDEPNPPSKPGNGTRRNFKTPFRDISPCFTEGPIATWEIHTTLKTRCRTPSCPRTSTWISSRAMRR
jgi:hypothetical protein